MVAAAPALLVDAAAVNSSMPLALPKLFFRMPPPVRILLFGWFGWSRRFFPYRKSNERAQDVLVFVIRLNNAHAKEMPVGYVVRRGLLRSINSAFTRRINQKVISSLSYMAHTDLPFVLSQQRYSY
jgi:hypothetical protein